MGMKGGNALVFLCTVILATMMKIAMGKGIDGTFFIFGDSILDVGTNNHFNDCTARADQPYYGIDYPHSIATGRFSNGYNSADFLAWFMSAFTFSPSPFLTLVDHSATFLEEIFRGANFASGGSGILNETGHDLYGRVVPLWEQIQQFSTVLGNVSEGFGKETAELFLAKSTYIISVGSNDLFESQKALFQNQTEPEQVIANLTANYAIHLQDLYDLGARKFAIIGVPPLGCCPRERYVKLTMQGNVGCVDSMNDLAQAFHTSTESLLQNFSSTNQGVVYSLGNTYNTIFSFIDNPRANGFQVVETACCGTGPFNAEKGCELGSTFCKYRDDYLFWDMFHPTQAAARLAALTLAYANGPEYVKPMNFSSLANALTYP